MMQPIMPQQRVAPLPIAQLMQAAPADPPPEKDAYEQPVRAGKKGELPMEIVAFAQGVYQKPQPQQQQGNKGNGLGLQPGWGGKGK